MAPRLVVRVVAGAMVWSFFVPLASATYSIVATDRATGEVGGAGTSCVGRSSVYVIYGSAPGFGAVQAQARVNRRARDTAVQLLAMGESSEDIIARITDRSFDTTAAQRQYGIVDLRGGTAGFTGSTTGSYAGDIQGVVGNTNYAIQGNILTGPEVLEQAGAAFEAQGCDLAERLMRALEAGGANGEGDNRCTPDGIPADGAFLQVDRRGEPAGDHLVLRVDNTRPRNPLVLLREQYDAWRGLNPCPVAEADAGPRPARDGGAVDAAAEATDAGPEMSFPGSDSGHHTRDASREEGKRSTATGGCSVGPTRTGRGRSEWLVFLCLYLGCGFSARRRVREKPHSA